MTVSYLELSFIIVVGIQIIYWVICIIGVVNIKSQPNQNASHGVSIIIAANNELQNLKELIPTLLKQTYHTFEIIIINDRSSDGTYDYLIDFSGQNPKVKFLTVDELPDHLNGKKYALTLGIKAAKYDQILLTDADCKPNSTDWITSFANSWSDKTSFILGFSAYERHKGLLNYFIRFETILTGIQYLGAAALGKPYMGVGRNLSYSRNFFLSKKGFHGFQGITGGDDDLFVNKYANSSNTSIQLSPKSVVYSKPKSNFSDFIVQKIRHLSVGKHYSSKSKIILGFFTFTWLLTWGLTPIEFILTQNLFLPISILLGRYILMGVAIFIFKNKSGAKLNLLGLILLDFMFVLYYFVTGIRTLLTKRVKWS